jgi:hypothetical protein
MRLWSVTRSLFVLSVHKRATHHRAPEGVVVADLTATDINRLMLLAVDGSGNRARPLAGVGLEGVVRACDVGRRGREVGGDGRRLCERSQRG